MSSFHFWRLLMGVAALLAAGTAAKAQSSIDTQAKQAYIVDYNTGTVLLSKSADDLMTPSSMSKLMTVYMVFSRLKEGSLKLTDMLPVSEGAWRKHTQWGKGNQTPESTMFLAVHSQAKIEDLLRGVIIQSGNDACSVLAEGLAGSEEAFAEQETKKAREIGMPNSSFRNASGMPEPGHQMTAHDLATLAVRLINEFPDYYPIFSEKSFTYAGHKQDNRNPLIWEHINGADGLKTGHTDDGGFGLTGSAIRDGRRIILVLNGVPTQKSRTEESQRLIEWAFREFEDYSLFKSGEAVTDVDVWQGVSPSVPATLSYPLAVSIPRTSRHAMKVTAVYDGPVQAPIHRGAVVGTLTVTAPGISEIKVPLIASTDVERLGFFGRAGVALKHLLFGKA